MAAHALVLLAAFQSFAVPATLPKSPGIWSPPKSAPAPVLRPSGMAPTAGEIMEGGRMSAYVQKEISVARRSGELSRSQARAFRRDLASIDSLGWGGLMEPEVTVVLGRLQALSSMIYAAGSSIIPK